MVLALAVLVMANEPAPVASATLSRMTLLMFFIVFSIVVIDGNDDSDLV